jgi:hypothetical protein
MNKLSIKEFHIFMRGAFKDSIEHLYKSHHIFCEADLQSFAWWEIKTFLEGQNCKEKTPGKFRVLNKPYLRNCRTYPDLVVFRHRVPWVVIELKESRILKESSAQKELDKLLQFKKTLPAKRGYLVYVARSGPRRAISGRKGEGGRYFFEVPIILDPEEWGEVWKREFRSWSKYVFDKE